MKEHDFQQLADRNLSGLVWDERMRRKVLCALDKEGRSMKHLTKAFILAAAILCISINALASGLVFSPRYSAGKQAAHVMQEQYGVTEELLSLFHREMTEQPDGTFTITYTAIRTDLPADQMGDYTIQVTKDGASASWSNDGKDTPGGLEAEAFGPEQLTLLSRDYASAMEQLRSSQEPQPAVTPASQAVSTLNIHGTLTIQQASMLAREAICQEYALTTQQQEMLLFEEDSTYAAAEDRPLATLLFWLWQKEDGSFTEKDGQYWVTVDLDTGSIEDILYDACLAGNG